MKPPQYIIVGAFGRMGGELRSVLRDKKTIEVDRNGRGDVVELNEITKPTGSIIIDFSSEEGLLAAVEYAIQNRLPLVSGTTGISAKAHKALEKAAKKIPVLWAPNMSLGIYILRKCIAHMRALAEDFDFQIEDFHHKHKKDAPSGTAKILQKDLVEAVGKKIPDVVSVRGGGIFGVHKVIAMSDEEVITFEHEALNRAVFAKGAVHAANWLAKQKAGQYRFEDVFEN